MCITEYNEAETMRLFFEEGYKKGLKRGGEIRTLVDLVNDGILSDEIAVEWLKLSLDEFLIYKEQCKNSE